MSTTDPLRELKYEMSRVMEKHSLNHDNAFTLWFLLAYLTDSEDIALKALTGGPRDKNIDAIVIDSKARQVDIVQCKYRKNTGHKELRNDVIGFARLASLPWADKETLDVFYSDLDSRVSERFKDSVRYLKSQGYALKLFYVTTGRVADKLKRAAESEVENLHVNAAITVLDSGRTLVVFDDYIDSVPSVPPIIMHISPRGPGHHEGYVYRHDHSTEIESWIFSMSGRDIGNLCKEVGRRLFARNIRGYRDRSHVNESMKDTIDNEPQNFWYYNNGITVVCDEARFVQKEGEETLVVEGAQIINGQQTTVTLSKCDPNRVSVLVRVIKIPRRPSAGQEYEDLVKNMVKATNTQNRIYASDLKSNDRVQVYIEKELRKAGYQYIRKSMGDAEKLQCYGPKTRYQIDKIDMAKAVTACEIDSHTARTKKDALFEESYYGKIFKEKPVSFYLSRYLLMKRVFGLAHGDRNRRYAKWLVLHLAWEIIGNMLDSSRLERQFRFVCEREAKNARVLAPLEKSIVLIFKSAQAFYTRNSHSGDDVYDLPTFFKRSKLDSPFRSYWYSRINPHRARFVQSIQQFETRLESLDME